jgi:hypothetical protein
MSTTLRQALDEQIESYFAFMGEHFPVMSASDEFIFFPMAESSLAFRDSTENLSAELISQGLSVAGSTLVFLENLAAAGEPALDIKVDARLLKMQADNFLRVFGTEKAHLHDPSLYFTIAAHGLALAVDDRSCLAGRLKSAAGLFARGKQQLESTSRQRLDQALIWSENFEIFTGRLSCLRHARENGEIISGLNALREQAAGFTEKVKRLKVSPMPESLGAEQYKVLLEQAFGLDKEPEELYEILLAERHRLTARLQSIAQSLGYEPAEWRKLAVDPPPEAMESQEPAEWYRYELAKLVRWLKQQSDTADIDTTKLPEVRVMPEYLCGLRASASYAAPLERDKPGVFYIVFDNSAQDRHSRLALHSDYRYITVHETFPGHHHLDATRLGLDSAIRRQSENALFYEGWSCWAEQRMVDAGYFHLPHEIMCVERRKLQRAYRSICELGLHLGKLDDPGAGDLLAEIGIKPGLAAQLIRQYRCQPGYQITYTIGRLELERLVEKFRPRVSGDHELCSLLLSAGEIPFDLLERHLETSLAQRKTGE